MGFSMSGSTERLDTLMAVRVIRIRSKEAVKTVLILTKPPGPQEYYWRILVPAKFSPQRP